MEKSKSLHCSHRNRKLLTKIFVMISNIVVSVVEKSFQTVKNTLNFQICIRMETIFMIFFVNIENVP